MKYLTSAEYQNSKIMLLSRLKDDPIILKSYILQRYCKISIGASLNTKDMFILKPKELIQVKWNYKDDKNPLCIKMIIQDIENDIYWKNSKIIQWLEKNTQKV